MARQLLNSNASIAIPIALAPDALIDLHASQPERYPALLESTAHGALGSFDILFAFPQQRLTLQADGTLRSSSETVTRSHDFLAALEGEWQRERTFDAGSELPFNGGWFLMLNYELAGQVEPSLRLPAARDTIAEALRIPAAVVVERSSDRAWIVTESNATHLAPLIERDIRDSQHFGARDFRPVIGALTEDPPGHYIDIVRQALDYIRAGDVYQANLSREWHAQLADGVSAHEIYRRLRTANPSPFAGIAQLEGRTIVSSSPERLLKLHAGTASTRPIAGTRPRSADASADERLLRELQTHPKEIAEHVMLLDLERNDLGRICRGGSVQVDEYMTLESYAHVHHIVSNVRGELRPDVTPGAAIRAVFPGGTITGCPKVRCMQIIGELERTPRGAYTGSMGYLNRNGNLDLNILIRTMEIRGRELSFRAGAGIVADSIAERELEETRAKARGLLRALGAQE